VNIHLTQANDRSKRAYLPFRVESRHAPNSLSEAQEAKNARDLVTSVNKEIERLDGWVDWIAGLDQSSQDLNPQPGKVAVLGAIASAYAKPVDGYADFQSASSGQLVAKQEVEKAELKINGKSQLDYSRTGDSIEVFVRQNGADTGFLISGSYGGPCTIRKEQR